MDEISHHADVPAQPSADHLAAIYLTGPDGAALLERAMALKGDVAARILALVRSRTGEDSSHARMAAQIAACRERAQRRGFANAHQLFFTDEALSQATSPVLSAYRAEYLARFGTVADLCCGVGMDSIALAKAGARVIAVDIDPVRLEFARANARVCGVADRIRFVQQPVEELGWTDADAAFFDPARRSDSFRFSAHGERYAPPLDFLNTIREHVRGGCAKLSPALPDDVLRDLSPSRIEFLSESRECKEACVWFGEATGVSGVGEDFVAVLLPERDTIVATDAEIYPDFVDEPHGYLLDPDPAVIRAGALESLGAQWNAQRISSEDAYLWTDQNVIAGAAKFASIYRILHVVPYTPKKITLWLKSNDYTRIVVKKRNFPQEPAQVARDLGMSQKGTGKEINLVIVRESGKRFLAVLCEPFNPSEMSRQADDSYSTTHVE